MADLLGSLSHANWQLAARVFGNSHATLTGLLVDWWISASPSSRWALDGGPSFAHLEKGLGGGLCDAVLGEGDNALGVIEVEGSRYDDTLRKIGRFFASTKPGLRNLRFGVFLAYAYSPVGRGDDKHFERMPMEHFLDLGSSISSANPDKQLALLTLDKMYGQAYTDPRLLGGWYLGRPAVMNGALIENGQVSSERFQIDLASV
jgi:hypothetical protein